MSVALDARLRGHDTKRRAQTEKLVPQPHAAVTLGLLILNWAPIRLVDEVDLGALHEAERHGIDHHARAVALDQEVVGRRAP